MANHYITIEYEPTSPAATQGNMNNRALIHMVEIYTGTKSIF